MELHRTYHMPQALLFGACMTALGQLRAHIESYDAERGHIRARIGAGPLAPVSELALTLAPAAAGQTALTLVWRARAWGGDRRIAAAFLDRLDALSAAR